MNQKIIKETIKTLQEGGVVLYPTDTIWGIGCDSTNTKAVERIYDIKKRNKGKALISLVGNKKQLEMHTNFIPKESENSIPTTIIYKDAKGLAKNLLAEDGTAAIRIVKDDFCENVILKLGNPIVATSANISGTKIPTQYSEIAKEIIDNVDYIVDLRKTELMSIASEILQINIDGSVKKIR